MLKFDVFTERSNPDGSGTQTLTVSTWLDASEIFAVRSDADPKWTVVTFKPTAGLRTLVVQGEADAIAAMITAERRRDRP